MDRNDRGFRASQQDTYANRNLESAAPIETISRRFARLSTPPPQHRQRKREKKNGAVHFRPGCTTNARLSVSARTIIPRKLVKWMTADG